MKYSFMTFSTTGLSLEENLQAAKRYGYDGIEPRLDAKHAHGIEVSSTPAQRRAVRKQASKAGIAIACLATSIKYADAASAAEMVRQTHERIDLAGDVGCPTLRVFGGQLPQGVTREQAVALLVESLSSVADHAGERGVTLCLETHDDWSDPEYVAEVLRKVNRPNVAVNWDFLHPVRSAQVSVEASFRTLQFRIGHVHAHDWDPKTGKICAIGDGVVDHRRAIQLLASIGYKGFISGEWIDYEPWEVHLPRELATMKRYEAEGK